jgi:hypothetical protein
MIEILKKYFPFLLLLMLIFFGSCEKDDICLEDITPHLIIRFYDAENRNELKQVINLKVELEGIEGYYGTDSITLLTDSIAIPIKVTDDITKYKLTISSTDGTTITNNSDFFELTYIREDEYISRSCGYKTVFVDGATALIDDTENWIKSVETYDDPQSILNENSAHVKIFH